MAFESTRVLVGQQGVFIATPFFAGTSCLRVSLANPLPYKNLSESQEIAVMSDEIELELPLLSHFPS